jgi:hypothetical protein
MPYPSQRRARTRLAVLAAALVSAALIAGCGGAATAAATASHPAGPASRQAAVRVATRFLVLAQDGEGARVCALMTPAQAAAQQRLDGLLSRYSSQYHDTCASGWSQKSNVGQHVHPVPVSVTVSGHSGHWKPPAEAGPGIPTALSFRDGRWELSGAPNPSLATLRQESDGSPDCIADWNAAIAEQKLQLPPLTGLSSLQVWAALPNLDSGGGQRPCEMAVTIPSRHEAFNYFEEPQYGPGPYHWTMQHETAVDQREQLQATHIRSVWPESDGSVIPASAAAPDGLLAALGH